MRPEAISQTAPSILPLRLCEVGLRVDGTELLKDVSFELQHGAPTVLLGPNGAGKTLLLKLCHGLLIPSSGTLRWLGRESADARLHHAMVFQKPVLLRRSVAANLEYALIARNVCRAERRARVARVLHETGLATVAHRAARSLSGGEQQRLALARALALAPEVLFLDEPTANLDPAASIAVEKLIQTIAEQGTKVFISTHDLPQARRLASEVLFLHRGQLLERSPARAFFDQPASSAAAAFVRGELWW